MPLSLKQARRMVAKSRRRVWRLAREAQGAEGLRWWRWRHRDDAPDTQAALLVDLMARAGYRRAGALSREIETRLRTVVRLELGRYERMAAARQSINNEEPHRYTAWVVNDENGPYCPICGAELERENCEAGCDEGLYDAHELYPLEYGPGELETCECCGGEGGYWFCPNGHAQKEAPDAP